MYNWLHCAWYVGNRGYWLLVPLSWLYALIILLRRCIYELGWRGRYRARVPVVIIGNLTAGGTGKTPAVIERAPSGTISSRTANATSPSSSPRLTTVPAP